MTDPNRICSKRDCNDFAVYKNNNTSFYCRKHYRFVKIRHEAKTNNKYQPSFQELEYLLIQCGKFIKCPKCNKKMILHISEGFLKDLITLQHNHDGSIELICYSCNCAHGSCKLEDKYFDIPKEHKYCPNCQNILFKTKFCKNKRMKDGMQNVCKECVSRLGKIRRKKRKLMGLCERCLNKISENSICRCDRHMQEARERHYKR